MKHDEYTLQKSICEYLQLQYPEVLFLSDTVASIRLTKMQAVRNKKIQKNGFKCPDLIILEPRGIYHGLFLELKIKSPFKNNGELYKNEHLKGQNETLIKLINKGYFACFSVGFDRSKDVIDQYMRLPDGWSFNPENLKL